MLVNGIRQLFLDDEGVGETFRVSRHYHSPVKYVGNPLLVGNAFHDAREGVRYEEDRVPREGGVPKLNPNLTPTSVVRGSSGTFQMYYQTRPPGIKDFGYGGGSPVVAYAESHKRGPLAASGAESGRDQRKAGRTTSYSSPPGRCHAS